MKGFEMTDGNGNRYVSLRWLVWALVALFAFVSTLVIADTKKSIDKALYATECLSKDKVEKADYYRDIGKLEGALVRIEEKIDKIRSGR